MNVTKFAQRHLRRHIYTSAKRSLLLLSSASAYLYAHFSLAPFISRGFLRRRAVIDSSTRRARSAANHRPDKSSSRFSDSAERGFPPSQIISVRHCARRQSRFWQHAHLSASPFLQRLIFIKCAGNRHRSGRCLRERLQCVTRRAAP